MRFSGDEVPKRGTELIDAEGSGIGILTSAKVSPALGHPISLTYIQHWQSATGTKLTVEGTDATAAVMPTPFYSRRHHK